MNLPDYLINDIIHADILFHEDWPILPEPAERWLKKAFSTNRAYFGSHQERRKEMNIYVGNLPFNATEDEVREVFAAFGQVTSVTLIKDKFTGQPRGFGFVEMPSDGEAQKAIQALNGKDFKNRSMVVNPARPREERGGGFRQGGGFSDQRRSGSGGGERRNRQQDRGRRGGGDW